MIFLRSNERPSAEQRAQHHGFVVFTAGVLTMCLLVAMVCLWFYGLLNSTIREESSGYLQEIAARVESNIDRIINDTYNMLYSTDKILSVQESHSFSDLRDISVYQQRYWKYSQMLLLDEKGNAFDVNGRSIFLSGASFLQDTLLRGKAAMSPLQVVDGLECSIFAVPIQPRDIGGVTVSALAATYNTSTLSQVLSMSSFGNQAYANIVSRDGTIIISSDSDMRATFGYNILSSIESSHSVPAEEMAALRQSIQNGETGQSSFTFNGRQEYMVYRPIGLTNWMLINFVPMDVVNAKSNILLSITLIIAGFITLAFSLLVALLLVTFRRHQRKLEQIAYVDDVTGGNTIGRFYELAGAALAAPGHPPYALVYANLCKFKVLNEKFGRHVGDEVLRGFHGIVRDDLQPPECVGRLSADNFCILLCSEQVEAVCQRLEQWNRTAHRSVEETKPAWPLPMTEFGIYVIENDTMPFPQMIDRAKLALRETPRTVGAKLRYAIYNDTVRSLLFREKQLEDMMEHALATHEFQLYLQPKYRADNETIAGAEALTRWMSASEGMIFPNEFIPLFEKNGFITQLDLWVFEEVCQLLRRWLDEGRQPVKISVNCSRAHLRDSEFLRSYRRLIHKYGVPAELIEIEITESFVLEDAERFGSVVEEIHQAGFGCSMDDFGSGYSSLNMLQDIAVDTLKLDKVFFHSVARDPGRTESVVSNIIGMAKALSMETVAEGVEHQPQVEMLRRIGCDLIQGYIFAKPMPVADFEAHQNAQAVKEG